MKKVMLLVGLTIMVVLLCLHKPSGTTANASGGGPQQPLTNTGSNNPQEVGRDILPAFARRTVGGAHEAPSNNVGPMSLYQTVAEWPSSMGEGKSIIGNFALALGLHDAILVNPSGSDEEIVSNARNLGVPEEFVRQNLAAIFEVEDFGQHLQRALLNPELRQVHDVLVTEQVQVNFDGDLLVDAFRLSAFRTFFGDFMDDSVRTMVEGAGELQAAHFQEIQRCNDVKAKAFETVTDFFRQRFEVRHGLPPEIASRVVAALSNVEVRTAPPPTMAVPRIRRL